MSKNKVDISKIDLEKEREKITDMPGLIEYAHTVGGAIIKPEDKGKIKGVSVAAMHDQTDRQFQQIYKQMQTLVDQAKYLQKRVEVSERIYTSDMGFKPIFNTDYYLYRRKKGGDVLSMVSPEEWGRSYPFEKFVAHVRLLSDHTWDIIKAEDEL
ncbi:MAG: DUF2452 domain-containing protein [Cyclobacteriaceae bacterium]